ncbi:hypothetical protein EBR44_01745 [bacterium]|nr:hypothetical protein [bacterium]
MRIRTTLMGIAALAVFAAVPATARAQGTGTGSGTSTGTPAKKHRPAPTAEQKAFAQAFRAQQKTLRDQVKAGTITKKSAAEQLKAWRAANKPTTKTP